MIMQVTSVDAVLLVKAVIEAHIIFAIVEWIGLLEDSIVGCWCIGVSHRQFLHGAED